MKITAGVIHEKKVIKAIEKQQWGESMMCIMTRFLKEEKMTNWMDVNILNILVSCSSHLRPDN